MELSVRTTLAVITALATASVLSLSVGAAPAFAATYACGATGALVEPGVCEQVFTAGSATFTPTAAMTTLNVLLVGAGGSGSGAGAAAGGGGDVIFEDFSGATDPLVIVVAASGDASGSEVTSGPLTGTANNGKPGAFVQLSRILASASGGASGSGKPGSVLAGRGAIRVGGGGALAFPAALPNGGSGVTVSDLAPGTLFSNDLNCYGGGGAAGSAGVVGTPGCGGGGPEDASATALTPAVANSGGGGGALSTSQPPEARSGANGLVVIRWNAAPITLSFSMNGHGVGPANQIFDAGSPGTQPSDPTADGYTFKGWFTDSALTTKADFTAAITEPTTLYASWGEVLALTGGEPNPAGLPLGIATLLAGAVLLTVAFRVKRREN